MKKYYNSELEIRYILLKKELEKCEDLLAEERMERVANPIDIDDDIDELYDLDDYHLEIYMYDREWYDREWHDREYSLEDNNFDEKEVK